MRRSLKEGLDNGTNPTSLQIVDTANMTLDDVWVAIGSLWEGLRSGNPRSARDAYAGMDLFYPPDTYFYTAQPEPVAASNKRFLMPILFAAEKDTFAGQTSAAPTNKDSEEVGHLLLAVAEMVGEPNEVQLRIYDSAGDGAGPNCQHILRRARNLIERGQWPNPAVNTPLQYRNSGFHSVPQQQGGTNTCGLYTIMNAWAVMLGIPIQHKDTWVPGHSAHYAFARVGLEIVNHALAGFMDSRTIQAFMNVHRYCKPQDATSAAQRVVPVNTVAMQQTRLVRKLHSQRRVDRGVSQGRSVSPDETAPGNAA